MVTAPTLRTDVLVVGAGPSGLMAAVCLARLGVDVTIVDGKGEPTRESRALALQARSMEIYEQLGLVDRVLSECDQAPQIVPGYRTRQFRPVSFAGFGKNLTPYPGIFVLEQSRNERILLDAFQGYGHDVRWRHELRDLRLDEHSDHPVEASLVTPDAPVTVRARWCIGADGASSRVRDLLGIEFEGSTNPLRFYVADALDVEGLTEQSMNMRVSRDDFVLAFPMGAPGHHRILGVVDDGASEQALEVEVRARLQAEFGVRYRHSAWFSSYRVHHRLAARFREGPVFLVGDAAHVHSPVGAQGMNTGLQDAHNLACKLADVIQGRNGPKLLDRYEAERRPVAQRLVQSTDALFARITSRGRLARFVRDRVVPLIAPLAVRLVPRLVGTERIYGYLAQLRIHYWASTAERTERHGRRDQVVGRRLPWSGGNFAALRSMTWQVHGYGAPAEAVNATAAALGFDAHAFAPDVHRRLDASRLYLVRPDGFVAAAAPTGKALALFRAYLAEIT
ncbi:MAG TPA: FAD-dependent monooxygenase [Pseudolysinimonas sp.]|nr:FAD-dependent monooxygenase [Pseudolysinimonas sp.]